MDVSSPATPAEHRDVRSVAIIVTLMTMIGTAVLLCAGSLRTAYVDAGRELGRGTIFGVGLVVAAVGIGCGAVVYMVNRSVLDRRLRMPPLAGMIEDETDRVRAWAVRVAVEASLAGWLVGTALGVALGYALNPTFQRSLPQVERGYHPFAQPTILAPGVVLIGVVVVGIVAARTAVSRARRAERAARGELRARPGRVHLGAARWLAGLLLVALGVFMAVVAAQSDADATARTPLVLTGMAAAYGGVAVLGPALVSGALAFLGLPVARSRTGVLALRNARRAPWRSAQLMLVLTAGIALITLSAVLADGVDGSAAVAAVVVVAIFGIEMTISRSVDERSYELAVMHRLGASERQIRRMLITEGALVGITSVVVGVVLGLGFALAITGGEDLRVALPLLGVLVILGPLGGAWAAYRPAVHLARVEAWRSS